MTLEPADWEASYIAERMKGRGILVSTEGPHHNVLKLKPPIIFRREDVDSVCRDFGECAEGYGPARRLSGSRCIYFTYCVYCVCVVG